LLIYPFIIAKYLNDIFGLVTDIYLKDIANYLHKDSRILLYANDIAIYSTSNNIHLARDSV